MATPAEPGAELAAYRAVGTLYNALMTALVLGLITRRQINGLVPVICGSENCSAQFFIREAEVIVRKPF